MPNDDIQENESNLDARLIERIQSDFPLESHPYKVLADDLGVTEQRVIERLRALQVAGTIREIGPVFELRRIGFTSTLCAAEVTAECLEAVAAFVSLFTEVTHNYERDHVFNLWFTIIAPSDERIATILDCIRNQDGVTAVYSMPATRTFKIKVHFHTAGDEA